MKCQAELRASVFEAIEEEDQANENEDSAPPALLGSCNDRAKQLHASPSGSFNVFIFLALEPNCLIFMVKQLGANLFFFFFAICLRI